MATPFSVSRQTDTSSALGVALHDGTHRDPDAPTSGEKCGLTNEEVIDLASKLPEDIEIIAEKIVDRLVSASVIPRDNEHIAQAQRTIASTSVLKGMVGTRRS
jgi:hypothetical protein